jgi:hypothetical protein
MWLLFSACLQDGHRKVIMGTSAFCRNPFTLSSICSHNQLFSVPRMPRYPKRQWLSTRTDQSFSDSIIQWENHHIRQWCFWALPNQNLVPEIQKWWFILQGSSSTRVITLAFGVAAWDISTKVSFCQRARNCQPFLYDRRYNQIHFPERVGDDKIRAALSVSLLSLGQKAVVI